WRTVFLPVKKVGNEHRWCLRRWHVGGRHGCRFSRFHWMRRWLDDGLQSRDELFHVGIACAWVFLHEALHYRGQGVWNRRVQTLNGVGLLGSMRLELIGRAAFKRQSA